MIKKHREMVRGKQRARGPENPNPKNTRHPNHGGRPCSAACRRLDPHGCLELVRRIERWGAESHRNKRCIAALGSAFDTFANEYDSVEANAGVLHRILPLPFLNRLGSRDSLRCMVWFLNHQDLSGKANAIVALTELLSFEDQDQQRVVDALAEFEFEGQGLNKLLVEFLNQRLICSPTITYSCLAVLWFLVSSSSPSIEKMKLAFIELGLVAAVLDITLDSDRSHCEKDLAIFDSLCSCEQGRKMAHALTIPHLVKKLLQVSALGTDYSVSSGWKLRKFGGRGRDQETLLVEALQVGAFQKLLLVLQVGCGDETTDKVTELLKLLNPYRPGAEYVDSDLNNLKRSI